MTTDREKETSSTVGLVLTSGGARGAYQAGVLSVLLPALGERGERPAIIAGTSAGAINALFVASTAHLEPEEQAQEILRRWRHMNKDEVLTPVWRQVPRLLSDYVSEVLGLSGTQLRGLLGVDRLERALEELADFPQVHANVSEGRVRVVSLMATTVVTGVNVGFVESTRPLSLDAGRVRWAPTPLNVSHVMASSAIPLLMPSVRVEEPRAMAGWYLDGSVSLRTPLQPALALGAERLAVIGCTPLGNPLDDETGADRGEPDLADSLMCVFDALLDDALVADLLELGRRNGEADGGDEVPHVVVTPEAQTQIGDLALEVLSRKRGLLRSLRNPDFPAVDRLLGGDSPLQGELLSYLLFDRDFIDELIELGARDARRRLAEGGAEGPWRRGDVH